MKTVRSLIRSILVVALLLSAVVDGHLRKWLGWMTAGPQGAVWAHRWCRRIVRALGIACQLRGPMPDAGAGKLAVVSNHMSYLDVLVYSAMRPFVMVSKVEVRSWPLIGWITAQAGTIYVERADVKGGQKQTHAEVNAQMAVAYRSGLPVMFFPEGTTGDGTQILPFRRGLFNSVIYDRVPLKVAAMRWELTRPNGGASVEQDLCFVGDARFGPHLFRLLGLRGIQVTVEFGLETVPGDDRFALAANSCSSMQQMLAGMGATAEAPNPSAAYSRSVAIPAQPEFRRSLRPTYLKDSEV
jgi:1-acyl-sn-glycerol-3-phosphate acyltransferase